MQKHFVNGLHKLTACELNDDTIDIIKSSFISNLDYVQSPQHILINSYKV